MEACDINNIYWYEQEEENKSKEELHHNLIFSHN